MARRKNDKKTVTKTFRLEEELASQIERVAEHLDGNESAALRLLVQAALSVGPTGEARRGVLLQLLSLAPEAEIIPECIGCGQQHRPSVDCA